MSTIKNIVSNWQTADNKFIHFDKVTHQHWSNIYWYHLIFANKFGMPRGVMINTAKMALAKINEKFKGEILEWKPCYMFEVRWLNNLDLLAAGVRIKNRNEIFYNDEKIGTINEEELREVEGIH